MWRVGRSVARQRLHKHLPCRHWPQGGGIGRRDSSVDVSLVAAGLARRSGGGDVARDSGVFFRCNVVAGQAPRLPGVPAARALAARRRD